MTSVGRAPSSISWAILSSAVGAFPPPESLWGAAPLPSMDTSAGALVSPASPGLLRYVRVRHITPRPAAQPLQGRRG